MNKQNPGDSFLFRRGVCLQTNPCKYQNVDLQETLPTLTFLPSNPTSPPLDSLQMFLVQVGEYMIKS